MMPAMRPMTIFAAAVCTFAAGIAAAHDYKAGKIRIVHPYAMPSIAGAPHGAAYIATLENTATVPDRLLRASTPAAARVELHTMSMDGGVMRMREVEAIPVAARETLKMRPGMGFHLMLMQLKVPLKVGDTFPLVLEFERGGKVEVRVDVQQPREAAAAHKH